LIAAVRTVTAVTELGLPAPETEREAREIARQLRAQADELDGGERQSFIASAAALIQQGNQMMRKAIREAQLAIGADPNDPELVAQAEEIIAEAYARLDVFDTDDGVQFKLDDAVEMARKRQRMLAEAAFQVSDEAQYGERSLSRWAEAVGISEKHARSLVRGAVQNGR
jgi:hypothetical protein